MNLQLFAQEKTEKATPHKRQKAREKGQVFSSREVTSALILITCIVILKNVGADIFEKVGQFQSYFLTEYLVREDVFTPNGINSIFHECVIFLAKVVAPILISVLLAGLISNYLQIGFIFSSEAITPKLDRINPLAGLKRMFSKRGLVELVKSVLKISIIGLVAYNTLKKNKDVFPLVLDMDLHTSMRLIFAIAYDVGLKAAITLLILAGFDYIFQRHEYETGLMMSKQDIKEEYKEVEGNPQIKSRIRQIQRQMARSRMMQDVAKADVVITNPTHFAVAIVYDIELYSAPVVLAKGRDKLAKRIKEIAHDENIPIVENKPLAQSLYRSVEIGDVIPEALYNAVAEILAFVYTLKERRI